jgi:hypothetical protein
MRLTYFTAAVAASVSFVAAGLAVADTAGRIAEEWAADDLAAVASQLGAIELPWASP